MTGARTHGPVFRIRRAAAYLLSLRRLRDVWMYTVRIIERMEDNHIFLSGAAIAFNTLLCFIPLVLIAFYVLGFYLGSDSAMRTIDGWLDSLQLVPFQREQLRSGILMVMKEFVRGSSLAGLIGLVGLLWTSSALFAALRTVLDRIYNVKDTRSIVVSKLKDLALVSLVGIALILITTMFYGITIVRSLAHDVLGLPVDSWLLQDPVIHSASLVLSFLVFCAVFIFVPDTRLPMRVVALTSGIATALWGIAKAVFAYYLANLWSIGKIYGPYAVLVATAIWVYYSSITLILAAEVGEMYLERKKLKGLFKTAELKRVLRSIHEPDLPMGTPSRGE